MAESPRERALADLDVLRAAIADGVGERSARRYEPPGRTTDRSALSFMSSSEAYTVHGERFAPFGRRVLGAALDVVAIVLIWFMGFTGVAALAVPIYIALPEGSPDLLAPVFFGFIATIPFWTLWVFNGQGWSPAGKVTHLRAVDEFGAAPGPRAGLIRTLALIPSILPLGLGFWAAAWDREGQTWHDRIAKTRVIELLR